MGEQGEKGDPGDPAQLDPDLTPVEKLIAGQGGAEAIMALATVQLELDGFRAVLDETFHPSDGALISTTFSSTTAADVGNGLLRLDYTKRNMIFGATLVSTEILREGLGYIDGIESVFGFPSGNMLSDRWASTIKTQALLNPYWIARSAVEETEDFEDAGVSLVDGTVHHVLRIEDVVAPLFVYVNARTGVISTVETTENDPVRGDVSLSVHYLGWRSVGDVRMPTEVYLAVDEEIVHGEKRVALVTNAALPPDTFEFPAGANPMMNVADADRGFRQTQLHQMFAHAVGIPLDGLQPLVTPTEVAPGVWLLEGGTHHSLAIEQANGVVIVEAPLDETRSEAILAWTATQFPAKPVSHAVNTHHHTDHAGGLRRFAAAGATIVVSEATGDFFEENLREPRSVLPDVLTTNPVAFVVERVPIGGSLTLPDATNPVIAHHINSSHAADMTTIYIPSAQLVFQSDLFNPNFPVFGGSVFFGTEYAAELERLALAISTVAGGHGAGVVTYAQFRAALGL